MLQLNLNSSPSVHPPFQLPEPYRILYIPYDFQKHAKAPGSNIIEAMKSITRASLDETGMYVHRCGPEAGRV